MTKKQMEQLLKEINIQINNTYFHHGDHCSENADHVSMTLDLESVVLKLKDAGIKI